MAKHAQRTVWVAPRRGGYSAVDGERVGSGRAVPPRGRAAVTSTRSEKDTDSDHYATGR